MPAGAWWNRTDNEPAKAQAGAAGALGRQQIARQHEIIAELEQVGHSESIASHL
jgi:hypothetical protein